MTYLPQIINDKFNETGNSISLFEILEITRKDEINDSEVKNMLRKLYDDGRIIQPTNDYYSLV